VKRWGDMIEGELNRDRKYDEQEKGKLKIKVGDNE